MMIDAADTYSCSLGPLSLDIRLPAGGLISGVGTGALVWSASVALAHAILEASAQRTGHFAQPGSAIELGCGCSALPAVALALAGFRVTATDTSALLPSLRANLAAVQQAASRAGVGARLHAIEPRALAWDDRNSLAALARDGEASSTSKRR